jgi:DHA2 family methylenomycin A resistance protein-like MFS transporter
MRSNRTSLAAACSGYFFVLLDVTIVNVALARIARDLGTSRADLQWVVDGYALVLAAMMLSAGTLADLYGRRRVFVFGLAGFGVASLLCGLAPGVGTLVAARVLQGLAAAAILPTSLAIVGYAFPEPRERARAIGVWAGVGSLALIAGPILGGALVDGLGWRAIFIINVPLSALALALTLAAVDESSDPSKEGVDVRGQVFGALFLGLAVFALIEGRRLGWTSPEIVASAVVALASLAAFLAAERKAVRPMLDLRFFRKPDFTAANVGAGLMNLGTLGALFALSLFLQRVQGKTPLETGLHLLPWLGPLALLAPLAGRLTGVIGPRLPAALGLVATGIGYLLLTGIGPDTSFAAIWPPLALAGVGLAAATPALVTGATAAVPRERSGMASAVNNTARQVGGAVGVALIGGLSTIGSSLAVSGAALVCGGSLVLLIPLATKPQSV